MKYGFIYPIIDAIITILQKLNIVEWVKWLVGKTNKSGCDSEEIVQKKRIAVDLFIVSKWIFLFWAWYTRTGNGFITFVVWYLILTNLLTYFYEHVWKDDPSNIKKEDNDRTRRKFLFFMLSFAFSNISFAYLYSVALVGEMNWPELDHGASRMKSLWFSMSNSVAANYEVVSTHSNTADSTAMIQLMITFIFVSVILGESIPSNTRP